MPKLASQMRDRIRQHRVKHRLQLAGRAVDDAQDLGGRGLLLQRFAQFARARLHLVEQAGVLDRDHRLVGEVRDQLDLLVGEGRTSARYMVTDPTASPSRAAER